MKSKLIFAVMLMLISTSLVLALDEVPIGLQKIIDYNKQSTIDFSVKISFFIAFVAGMLGILSPCILPLIPAYFSFTFKDKKNITKMSLVFFAGFSIAFVIMGIIAGFIGSQTFAVVQTGWLVRLAGLFMIWLGFISFKGKTVCSFMKTNFKSDVPGTFLFGLSFAIGWTACLGPILAGILGMGAILGSVWSSGLLMLFYSFGTFVPLFLLSILYDKFDFSKSKIIQGKLFKFEIDDKVYHIHSTNLISGILFIAVGLVLIIFKGTAVFNTWDIFRTKQYFFSIQRLLIDWQYANIVGVVTFVLFVVGVILFLRKKSK